MSVQSKFHKFKTLRLVLGNQTVDKFSQATILIVGVGGIGCEILKNVSKFPIKKVVIIDLDVIELSNLNRQFYFRKQHLQQSKSKVAKQQILKLVPDLNIEAIQGNIYDKKYDNYNFYSQFDLVISALDNMKARQYLSRNCTRFGKVLVDAGTSGFHGQSYPSIRFLTSCHNCYPSTQEENFAICTIRTRPQRSIHCAIYAQNLYQQFFCHSQGDFLHKQILQIKQTLLYSNQALQHNHIRKCGQQLFNYLFHGQFKEEHPNVNSFLWSQNIQMQHKQQFFHVLSQIQDTPITLPHYAQIFMTSFIKLVQRKLNPLNTCKIPDTYDKDDEDCSLFVFSIANLRILNFNIQSQNNTKMKNITHQQCRKMLGKLIPAIASTNSIAASLEINQIKDFFSKQHIPQKYMTISPFNEQKISFSWLSLPNLLCAICSPKNIYFQIKCKLSERTFGQFQQFASINCYSYGRDLHCGSLVLIKNVNSKKLSPNKKKPLNFKLDLLIQNTLTLSYLPTSQISDLNIEIILIDDTLPHKDKEKFIILNLKDIQSAIKALGEQKDKQQQSKLGNQDSALWTETINGQQEQKIE